MEEQKKWAKTILEKIDEKLQIIVPHSKNKIPYTTVDGVHTDYTEKDISWWTNGFWPGMMWLMYRATGKELYKEAGKITEEKLDSALEQFTALHHDVGFMWLPSAVADYRLTGNNRAKERGLHAATILAGRFNPNGNFIRAWNHETEGDGRGWVIIDSMMNIPILYWASDETRDPRFRQIAMKHADTVMNNFVRPDGSVKHIVEFNPESGEYVKNYTGQGYSENSSWTRGQAWALYGFVLSYIHTGKQEYLDTAKRVAHYFISNLREDIIPPCDFRSPKEPLYRDTTAGMCAVCGMIEIAKNVSEFEKELYLNPAIEMLKTVNEKYCNWNDDEDSIVQMGTEAYHFGEKNIPIIYADFYFIEALLKLSGDEYLIW